MGAGWKRRSSVVPARSAPRDLEGDNDERLSGKTKKWKYLSGAAALPRGVSRAAGPGCPGALCASTPCSISGPRSTRGLLTHLLVISGDAAGSRLSQLTVGSEPPAPAPALLPCFSPGAVGWGASGTRTSAVVVKRSAATKTREICV